MPTSAKTSATPAQPQPKSAAVFEWYDNRVQMGLERLHRDDLAQRQKILNIIEELKDARLFWKLLAKYHLAVETQGAGAGNDALLALLARIYIAGTERGFAVLD